MKTVTPEEEYVRIKWERPVLLCDGSYRTYPRGTVLLQDRYGCFLDFESWDAAYQFTKDREEQIRQVEEEVKMVQRQLACQPTELEVLRYSCDDIRNSQRNVARWSRILAREQAALAELKKVFKP